MKASWSWMAILFVSLLATKAQGQTREQRLKEADHLTERGERLYEAGKYAEAMPLVQRGLLIREELLGPVHPLVADALTTLGTLWQAKGAYDQAKSSYVRAVLILERALGPNHTSLAQVVHNLSSLYLETSSYELARTHAERALQIWERAHGPNHPDVAKPLNTLAILYKQIGAYEQALPIQQRALRIREESLGPKHPWTATTLDNLAVLHVIMGAFDEARPLMERALRIREEMLGPKHPEMGSSLNNLAQLFNAMGSYEQARVLQERALRIWEESLGPKHARVSIAMSNLADTYRGTGAYEEARSLYERALRLNEETLGSEHPNLINSLERLGALYQKLGLYERARPLHERALQISEKSLGPKHAYVAHSLGSLANLHRDLGAYDKADSLYRRVLQIQEETLSPDHPMVATSLASLAYLLAAQGRPEALSLLRRALAIWERTLRRVRLIAHEPRIENFLSSLETRQDQIYSMLSLHPTNMQARELALATALLRKGRALDEAASIGHTIRSSLQSQEDQRQFHRLLMLRRRLASLELKPPNPPRSRPGEDPQVAVRRSRQEIEQLQEEAELLEEKLAQRSASLGVQRSLPDPDRIVRAVAAALPQEGVLIELLAFRPFLFSAKGTEPYRGPLRHMAMILFPDARIEVADLGTDVDEAVGQLLPALAGRRPGYLAAAQRLHRLVLDPLRPLLKGRTKLYLSLDGQLQLVPFWALHDGQDFLLARYRFTYLTSGRDLLRPPDSGPPATQAVVLANPAFDQRPPAPTPGLATRRSRGLGDWHMAPLPGTDREAQAIAREMGRRGWSVQQLSGAAATEEAFLRIERPRILHVATHGLFWDDEPPPFDPARGSRAVAPAPVAPEFAAQPARALDGRWSKHPLLRSALALAGANLPPADDAPGDGLATGLEVAGMNLWGTELVVLSACDSGRGDVRRGQGVYGLRRAFLIAGAQTLVTSLWRVDDEATRALMVRYYQNLLGGADHVESLRQAALAVRRRHPHPYYWAPFVIVGRGGPLSAKPPAMPR
jgi:CHAT domain-containing protein/lipopolysaccharide biosynthesis regulator YciM